MRVLAVDPGYDRLGVAVLEYQQQKETLLYSSCIQTNRKDTLPDRLLTLGEAFQSLLTQYTPTTVAVETLFFNQNQKTGIAVAQARGVTIFLARQAGCEVYEFGPQEIKVAVTGYGNSDKQAVIAMVKQLVAQVPNTALDDEYDAIAVGITCLAQYGRTQ